MTYFHKDGVRDSLGGANKNGKNSFSGHDAQGHVSAIGSAVQLPHNQKDEKELDKRNKMYSFILENYSHYIEMTLKNNSMRKKML